METYTFLKGRQDNKWCFFKKFDFSTRTKKVGWKEYLILVLNYKSTNQIFPIYFGAKEEIFFISKLHTPNEFWTHNLMQLVYLWRRDAKLCSMSSLACLSNGSLPIYKSRIDWHRSWLWILPTTFPSTTEINRNNSEN